MRQPLILSPMNLLLITFALALVLALSLSAPKLNILSLRLPRSMRRSRHVMPYLFGRKHLTRLSVTTSWTGEWSVCLIWGQGAGYIGGGKVYAGFGRVRLDWVRRTYTGFALGVTRNGNLGVMVSH